MAAIEKGDADEAGDASEEGNAGSQMTFGQHLSELRSRLIKSVLAIGVGFAITFIFWNQVLDVFKRPYCRGQNLSDEDCILVIIDPVEGFLTRGKVSLYGGIALAMPVILWQLWRFISPALHKHERRYAVPFVTSATILFLAGAALAYWTLEKALGFLIDIAGEGIEPFFRPSAYMGFVTFMVLAFGVAFQVPILLIFLQLARIVTPQQLGRVRRFAIVGIVVAAAVITPSGDPLTLSALSIPLYIFYEGSIVIGRLLTRDSSVPIRWWPFRRRAGSTPP